MVVFAAGQVAGVVSATVHDRAEFAANVRDTIDRLETRIRDRVERWLDE
jgi:predicted component of type VI protein secretion system